MGQHALPSLKPHLLGIGRQFLHQKFECPRCHRQMVADAFSPMRSFDAALWNDRYPRGCLLYPVCKGCIKAQRSAWWKHPKFSLSLFRCLSRLLGSSRGSTNRGRLIRHLLEVDDLLELYFLQDGKCALSGVPLTVGAKTKGMFDPTSASIDRIDSSGAYERSNIQLVCARVNIMKHDMHHRELIQWCRHILANQMAKEDELLKLIA